MTSLLMSSPPISIKHPIFRSRYSNSRDVVATSHLCSLSAARAPRRACSHAIHHTIPFTFLLKSLKNLKMMMKSSILLDQFSLGKISILGLLIFRVYCHLIGYEQLRPLNLTSSAKTNTSTTTTPSFYILLLPYST